MPGQSGQKTPLKNGASNLCPKMSQVTTNLMIVKTKSCVENL